MGGGTGIGTAALGFHDSTEELLSSWFSVWLTFKFAPGTNVCLDKDLTAATRPGRDLKAGSLAPELVLLAAPSMG